MAGDHPVVPGSNPKHSIYAFSKVTTLHSHRDMPRK